MTGASVLIQPNVTSRFSTLFAKLGTVLRRMVSRLFAAPKDRAIPRPFPFLGE
jgi:hypothetical protein